MLRFPLKLVEVRQVDWRESPAVQLADVLIGATLEAANVLIGNRTGGVNPEELLPLFADDQFLHLVPDTDFEAQRRFRRGTQSSEMIKYFARHFVK